MRWTIKCVAALFAFGLFAMPGLAQERGVATGVESPDPVARIQDQAGLAYQNQLENRNYERSSPLDAALPSAIVPAESNDAAALYGAPSMARPYPITRPGALWSGPRGRGVYRPTYTFPYPYGVYLGRPNETTTQFIR
jgi:hypothetical protein